MPRKRKLVISEPPQGALNPAIGFASGSAVNVGEKLYQLRSWRGYSIRHLAEMSGLAINTLSLIENGKTSPSVSTLQQVAMALEVPITAFFEMDAEKQAVICSSNQKREQAQLQDTTIEDLSLGKYSGNVQALLVTLPPESQCGERNIVHNGHEIVFCLSGRVHYRVDGQIYVLEENDSLMFEAHLPHCWKNEENVPARLLLVMVPNDPREKAIERHFGPLNE
ncbi:helix-turn-helix domain-containing protein [Ornatilinea apprima]|uniref:helix-turn-helix domain-containing protein n=1 Tax=Ornatilinea apprima TaxID=1134406 RepID=UPI0009E945C2|nr:XRE family transcriptional regulator [Ornatilinea apprima]